MKKSFHDKSFYKLVSMILSPLLFLLLLFQTSVLLAESLEEGAKREGRVMFYTTIPIPYTQILVNAFNERYPFIKAEFYRVGTGSLITKVFTEKKMGRTFSDVLSINGTWVNLCQKEGILQKYISPELKFFPQGFRDPESTWFPSYNAYFTFIYNTKMVAKKDIPKTYDDLLNPKWKGKIGISSDELEWFIGMLDFMGEEKGKQFMKYLGEQDPTIRTGRTLIANLMVAGEFPLALSLVHTTQLQQKAGAPIDILSFPVPTLAATRMIGIHANAPHPNAAKLFVNFLLSNDGQGIFNSFSYHPVRMDVQITDPAVEAIRRNLFPIKPKNVTLTEGYKKEFDKIFKKR